MQTSSQIAQQPVPTTRASGLLVGTLVGAAFMAALDTFVVNLAFDDIARDYGAGTGSGPSISDLSWVLNAYTVLIAALLVPFGRLADRYGRRRMFIGGLSLFVGASLGCALSGSVWMLVAFRCLQAIGAAAMSPTSLSLLLAALPPERRAFGARLWATTGAIAAAIGPLVGGALAEVSWHWVFGINLPIGLALIVLALRLVHESPSDRAAARPDLGGAVVFATAMALLALGLVKSKDWGWQNVRTELAFAGAVVAMGYFWFRSGRHHSPVIDPALLRIATFRNANATMLTFNVAFGACLLLGILWLRQIWGYSAIKTGLAVAVGPAVVPVTAVLTQRLLPTVRPGRLIAAGSLVGAAGAALLALRMDPSAHYAANFLPGWLLLGVGVGLNFPNLLAVATADLPTHQSATGSGIITMARQIGFVVGVSILFAIVGSRQGFDAESAFRQTLWVAVGVFALSAVAAAAMTRQPATATLAAAKA